MQAWCLRGAGAASLLPVLSLSAVRKISALWAWSGIWEKDQESTEHRGTKNMLGQNRQGLGKYLIPDPAPEAWVEVLVEATTAADTCLVFGNGLSATPNADLTDSG